MRPEALTFRARVGLVAAFALVLLIRMPDVVLHGRLWAEEGPPFYLHAANLPWFRALTLPYGGYLNLVANGAPILARHLVRLDYVPWVDSFIGLLFQCCPAILLVGACDRWLHSRVVLVAALLLVATAPLTEEVWLQTLHSQFHLALCAAVILALDIPRRLLAIFGAVLLFLGPLCGPAASVLLPLFLLRAGLERSWARAAQAAFLGAGTALQLLLFYNHQAGRSYGIGPIVLLCVIYIKHLVAPFLGRHVARQAVAALQARIAARLFPWAAVFVSLTVFSMFWLALLRARRVAPIWLFMAACLTGWIAYFGAIGGGLNLLPVGGNGRYTFVPEVLSWLALLGVAAGHDRPERWLARVAVVWLLIAGAIDLRASEPFIAHGPDWLGEVSAWRRDHAHPIAIWPVGWKMSLAHE